MRVKNAVFAIVGFAAAPVWAQESLTSLTVFGVADSAGRSVSNEGRGSIKSLVSGGNSTSRLGFRGREDMGGGLAAGFHLEHGIALDSGTAASTALFWDRRATVSLFTPWGEVRAGRDLVPTYVNWGRYDPFTYVGAASSSNLISATPVGPINAVFGANLNTTVRSNNAVQYLLPSTLGGLEGGVMIAAGEGGLVTNNVAKYLGARLGFATPIFDVSAAAATTENSLTTAGKFKDYALAGSYNPGFAKFTAGWREFKYNTAKQNNLMLAVLVPVGQMEFKASWQKVNMKGNVGAVNINANDATQLGLGGVYNLSKRTALYATLARISNDGAATFNVPGGPAGMAGGGTSTGYEFGMRHNF